MSSSMSPEEVWSSLHKVFGMSARELYDNDEMERLHRRCVDQVENMARAEKRDSLSRFVRDHMLSEEALAQGSSWETVLSFLDWVECGME